MSVTTAPGWQPIETAPRDGTFILLAGPSGYLATPLRVCVARWYPEYRPHNPWQTHSNDAFTDGGEEPTLWMPLPPPPPPTLSELERLRAENARLRDVIRSYHERDNTDLEEAGDER